MRRTLVTLVAAMLWSLPGWADEAPRTLTVKEVYEALGKLVDGGEGERTIEELSILIAPLNAEPLQIESFGTVDDMRGRTRFYILANAGKCTGQVKKRYVKDFGFYVVEFCENSSVQYIPWGDFHRLGDGGGALGSLLGTLDFDCARLADYRSMTTAAQDDFCP